MQHIIPLSPIDHVFTGTGSYPIEFVFSYDGYIDEKQLQSSLKETLRYFPPLHSQLVKTSDEGYGFDTRKHVAHFEVTATDLNFAETEQRAVFIDPVDSVVGEPLARIRLTNTPKGSVLGVSISHAVADGFSYFYFLTSWAKIFHGKSIYPPAHDRQMLGSSAEKKSANPLRAEDVLAGSGLFLATKRKAIPRDTLVWETIRLHEDNLKNMLEEIQSGSHTRFSYNDAITTMLCRKYLPQWNSRSAVSEAYVSCPVDFRRLLDGFPQNYFGNAVALATTRIRGDQLLPIAMSDLALKIRKRIGEVNENYVMGSMETLSGLCAQEGVQINEQIHVAHPQSGLLVTNLSRLPVREIEFNAGPPTAYEILTPAQRSAVVLPGKNGVEIRVCCPVAS
jgi:shikimate O-hydroxycinnamoyltransferase